MKRRRGEKEKWEDFEARVGIKRSGGNKEAHTAGLKCRSQVTGYRLQATGQVTGHRPQVRSQATGQVTGHTQKQ